MIESRGLLKTAVVARAARRRPGAPVIGLAMPPRARATSRRPGCSTRSTCAPRQTHSVRRSRLLGAALTGMAPPEPPLLSGRRHAACTSTIRTGPPAGALCGLLHATRRRQEALAAGELARAGQRLRAEGLAVLLPWGNEAERRVAEEIAAGVPQAQVLPRASVMQGFGLINRAEVVVGVDTGLIHIAAALCRPTVEIYTATWRWKTEGYWSDAVANVGDDGVVPTVDEVYAAAPMYAG